MKMSIKGVSYTNHKYRVLFYRPDIDGHLLDNGIAGYTWLFNPTAWFNKLSCSHVVVWESDEEGVFYDRGFQGTIYHSTFGQLGGDKNRPRANGTIKQPACEVLKNPHRWFGVDVKIMGSLWNGFPHKWLNEKVINNKGYDFAMIFSFFLPFRVGDKLKDICSEFAAWFLGNFTYLCKDKRSCPSPTRLACRLYNENVEFFYDIRKGDKQ
jgi:hypothetical protein